MAGMRRWRTGAHVALGTLVVLANALGAHAADVPGRIERIDLVTDAAATKIVVTTSRPLVYDVHELAGDASRKISGRLVVDFQDTTLAPAAAKPIDVANDVLRQIRPGQFNARTARIVLDLAGETTHAVDASPSPPTVTITLGGTANAGAPAVDAPQAAKPVAAAASDERKSTESAAASGTPPSEASTAGSDAPKQPVRKIPIRARGRRPYSLDYWR